MSNRLVDAFRRDLAARGQVDPRDDDYLTLELGRAAEQNNRDLFDQYGDFAQEYRALREANAPSLPAEAGRALKSGTQGLASTALGGLGLVTGSDYLKEKARSFDEDAAANAPTIPALEDIAPGEPSTAKKVFSRDALRYGIAKVGSVAPSIAESVATGAAGAALGSAAAPGPGTLVGAAGGVLEKSLVKAAIRRLLAKGVAEEMAAKGLIGEATEAGIEQALRAGSKAVAGDVAAEAAAIGSFRGGVVAGVGSSFLLNAGDVASEGADTPTTLALGVVSALPDTILPAYVLKKLFPGVAKKAAVEAGKTWLARHGTKIAELAGVPLEEFGQEYFQEAVNVVAKNIKEGKDPLTFDEADLRRLREAGIAGAAGGLLAAPGVMVSGRAGAVPTAVEKPNAETIRRGMAERALTPTAVLAPVVPIAPAAIPIERRVALMSDDQQAARLAELAARTDLIPAEQSELDLLRALRGTPTPIVSTSAPAAATPTTPPLDERYTQPTEPAQPAVGGETSVAAPVVGAAAGTVVPVEIGPRNADISTGTGVETAKESQMMADWRKAIAAEQISTPAPVAQTAIAPTPTVTAAGMAQPIAPAPPSEPVMEAPTVPPVGPAGATAAVRVEPAPELTGVPTVAPPEPERKFSRAEIASQQRVLNDLEAKVERAAKSSPARAAEFQRQATVIRQQIAEMEANRRTGPRPTIGYDAAGQPDILSDIADEIGLIRTSGPDEWGLAAATNEGIARRLRGGEKGYGPTDLLDQLNKLGARDNTEGGRYNFQSPAEVANAIIAAVRKRTEVRKQVEAENTPHEQTKAFQKVIIDNEGRRGVKAGPARSADELAVGETFKGAREGFEVVDVDPDNGDVIVRDGPRFGTQTLKAGETFYPDRGTLRRISKKDATFLDEEDKAAPAQEVIPGEPPLEALKGRTVELAAVQVDGTIVKSPMDAAEAWASTKQQISLYQEILACLKRQAT